MSTTFAAMKAHLGNTDYYILSMKAQELVNIVKIPKELDGWEDLKLEERYQRDINYTRVRTQIAPYLANDPSRFFGAIIVAAMNFDDTGDAFEPLDAVLTRNLPSKYRGDAEAMGFLTLRGGEVLVPLDGQHRLKAIEFAITGRDREGKAIPDMSPCIDLAQEDVTVVLVPYVAEKARRIFTRVNRYARPTTAGQNYITDDDDIIAVLSRQIVNDHIGGRLAKYHSNTLTTKDPEFTTLAIVYNCNDFVIENTFPGGKVDKTKLPDQSKQTLFRDKVSEVWGVLLEQIDVFVDALSDPEETGDAKRKEIRSKNLLGKPVAQECLVRAYVKLTGAPTNMASKDACQKLNVLPWDITEANVKVWQNVLWSGGVDGKIITKKRVLASDLLFYLAGGNMTDQEKDQLLMDYRKQFPEEERPGKELPQLS